MTLRTAFLAVTLAAAPQTVLAQAASVEGQVSLLWIDPVAGPPPPPEYRVLTRTGEVVRLDSDRMPPGTPAVRDRDHVRVQGTWLDGARTGERVLRASSILRLGPAQVQAPPATTLRYLTFLCEAPGGAPMHYTPATAQPRWGKEFPGTGHFLNEISGGTLDFESIETRGPFLLPSPAASYGHYSQPGGFDNDALTRGCLAAAGNPDFTGIDGVNFQFDIESGVALGGGITVTVGGQPVWIRATWIPDYHSGFGVLAHEVGHTLGWAHTGSDYGHEYVTAYDNAWDVMSLTNLSIPAFNTSFGFTGTYRQTVAAHRAAQGWIPTSRWLRHPVGTEAVYRLETNASSRMLDWQQDAVEMIDVTSPAGARYSLEARLMRGNYDFAIPAAGVIMHRLLREPAVFTGTFAKLVDADLDGNPYDESPVWTEGEEYTRPGGGFSFVVLDSITDGYIVQVRSGWRLRVEVEGHGKVAGLLQGDCVLECSELVGGSQSPLTLVATSVDPEMPFRGWLGDCSGAGVCHGARDRDFEAVAWFGRDARFLVPASRPFATTGTAYRDTLRVDAVSQATWSLRSGALPAGISLNAATGALSGTPTTPGTFNFAVRATAGSSTADREFTVQVHEPFAPVAGDSVGLAWFDVTWIPLVPGTGVPATVRLISGAWPDGMSPDAYGLLSGMPSQLDQLVTATFEVVRGGVSTQSTWHFRVFVRGPEIDTDRTPDSFVGLPYSFNLRNVGSLQSVWTVIDGGLPPGMTLLPSGLISGRAEQPGSYRFTVEARLLTLTDVREYTMMVAVPSLQRTEVMSALLRGTGLSDPQVGYLDFIGNRNSRFDLGDARAWLRTVGAIPTTGGAP